MKTLYNYISSDSATLTVHDKKSEVKSFHKTLLNLEESEMLCLQHIDEDINDCTDIEFDIGYKRVAYLGLLGELLYSIYTPTD